MMRITALNEESEEESETEEEVTKEALEEIALQQYAKTLDLQKKGNSQDALQLLKDLLDTELLDRVTPEEKSSASRPLLNLKYLCYRNVASLSAQLGNREAAVDAYLQASELDGSDVTLWFRLGKISLQLERFHLASHAFQRGVECNHKHWPCLDNLITLLLGLGNHESCLSYIYGALELDPDYFRGRLYRKHIYTEYPYILEYFSLINPLYKWKPEDDKEIIGKECEELLAEASSINKVYTDQIINTKVDNRLPVLPLNKPIDKLSWLSLGESLTDMHRHMTDKLLSHACVITMSMPLDKSPETVNPVAMEVDIEEQKPFIETPTENVPIEEKDKPDKIDEEVPDKPAIADPEKIDVEPETSPVQDVNKSSNEGKDIVSKKNVTRRRGSSLSFLEQWEWCNKRRSSRKKTNNRQDRVDETIYDTLKRLLPPGLQFDEIKQDKVKEFKGDESLDTMDLYKLFEEKEKTAADSVTVIEDSKIESALPYFDSEKELNDVQAFIKKYAESECDIITMIDEYVSVLSDLWDRVWPQGLGDIYIRANLYAKEHSDPPVGYDSDSYAMLKTFLNSNILHLELDVDRCSEDNKGTLDLELLHLLKFLCARKEVLGVDALNITMRYLWVKCHAHLNYEQTEFALDCLYYINYELNLLSDEGNTYSLKVPNFTKQPVISKHNCIELIKSLERNKKLSTVLDLYNSGRYEEVLPILQDSYKHCQIQANKLESSEMALDWAAHLMTLVESLWALGNTEQTFTWAVICLHESLKQFLVCVTANEDYDKWSLTVIKMLLSIEHIIKQEGSTFFNILPDKGMTHLVQDLIQIIVHQLDDSNNVQDMPIDTVIPWILLHYIFQREEDCGRNRKRNLEEEGGEKDEIPASLSILFIAHDYLGKKSWCCNNDGYLLYFTLSVVIPRLKSPALTSVVESVSQCLEQTIFCLFGHPTKKTKLRYLADHNINPLKLDWQQAQQIFDLYKPDEMPEFNSYRLASITAETEQLLQRMLSLFPGVSELQSPYVDVIAFIESRKDKLPNVNIELPFKMRDIYYLLADFYLKNNETLKALKYYAYDIVICKNRFDSWAGMALARGSLLETKVNSCEIFKTEMEYLNRAAAVECCFKKALEIDSSHSMLWIEYGSFVYGVHSFCARMLKQASESLSMESFEVLENRKENMLDTAHKCFLAAHKEWMTESEAEDKGPQDERWLHYYMLGKISEKKNETPEKYLKHYTKAGKFLMENNATYPIKINYNNPQNLSVEALEIHYRIHASILKYIEQHENKAILMSNGIAFKECLTECAAGPFSLKKKNLKESQPEKDTGMESNAEAGSTEKPLEALKEQQPLGGKRLLEESEKNESENKKIKVEETLGEQEPEKMCIDNVNATKENESDEIKTLTQESVTSTANSQSVIRSTVISEAPPAQDNIITEPQGTVTTTQGQDAPPVLSESVATTVLPNIGEDSNKVVKDNNSQAAKPSETEVRRTSQESATTNTVTSREDSSSESSSDSSSDDSSSDSSSDSSTDSAQAKQALEKLATAEMTPEDINEVISMCLESLEDCVSRFPQHYKAIYRLAHYHFYYKKDKNVERCRDLMLASFNCKSGNKLQGLFCERKNSNFFNGIWRIPASEVDRPGSFASHMSRCVLITMEVLKEIDDHKTLLDLCLYLQRTPDADKKYIRDSERGELTQQALSLCIRSLKGQLFKFTNQSDLKTNLVERKALSSLMLDIYRAYQKVQKHVTIKSQVFATLLVDTYKLFSGNVTGIETVNLLELAVKHCQALILTMKQQASAPPSVSQINTALVVSAPKKTVKNIEQIKPVLPTIPASTFLPMPEAKPATTFSKNVFPQNVPTSYIPPSLSSYNMPNVMDRALMSALNNIDQAALSYVSNMGNLAGLTGMSVNNYQTDLLRQFIATSLDTAYMQQMKPSYNQSSNTAKVKPTNIGKGNSRAPSGVKLPSNVKFTTGSISKNKNNMKNTKSFPNYNIPPHSIPKKILPNDQNKAALSSAALSSIAMSSPALLPAQMNPVTSPSLYNAPIPNMPSAHGKPHMTGTSNYSSSAGVAKPAHMTTTSTVNAAIHTKPPLPHQQVSPGKTLQEKLAERQKQNEGAPKSNSAENASPRAAASVAFSGKIPSSLTITKAAKGPVSTLAVASEEHKSANPDALIKTLREAKKSIQFDQGEMLAKPKNIIDTSEVIVLDDD